MHLSVLRELVTGVSRKNVDPEINLRQFLQAFNDTTSFREAMDLLDPETRKKVEAFRDGASAHAVTKTGGFQLPPSPAAKHHFRLLDRLQSLFHLDDKGGKPQPKSIAKDDPAHAIGEVIIYEDANKTKIMKV